MFSKALIRIIPNLTISICSMVRKKPGGLRMLRQNIFTQTRGIGNKALQQRVYRDGFQNLHSNSSFFKRSVGKYFSINVPMKHTIQRRIQKLQFLTKMYRHSLLVCCVVCGGLCLVFQSYMTFIESKGACETTVSEILQFESGSLIKNFFRSVEARTPALSHLNFIADVVEKAGPAVVFLEVKGEHPDSGRRITLSNGSGFIVRPYGLILTSAHVVANKSKVIVKLQDGDVFEGTVTAVDPVYDLATIKIDANKKLPALPLGNSSEIRPGEFVVAMGSPLSLNNTVTSGIVSSSLRGSKELGLDNKNMQYIQTDAVISFGNSGGPLVNLDGNAIGINNLKITSGISFAIPSDYAFGFLEEAERIMEKASRSSKPSYIDSGKESRNKRRFMGISMLTLTPLLLNELKDRVDDFPPVDNGVYVHKVIVGSPAYEGGIHAGDIIVEVNGNTIASTADIYREVELSPRLNITTVRGNYLHKISVTTEELF